MSEKIALKTIDSQEWETPQWLFNKLNKEYDFTLDPCATDENFKCEYYYTKKENGLRQIWLGNVFVNPPFKDVKKWVEKAWGQVYSAKHANIVVMLLPARTDTRWFHEYIWSQKENRPRPMVELRFLKGRLKFGGAESSAPFPSMVVIFKKVK